MAEQRIFYITDITILSDKPPKISFYVQKRDAVFGIEDIIDAQIEDAVVKVLIIGIDQTPNPNEVLVRGLITGGNYGRKS